jgi:hypothetical protein
VRDRRRPGRDVRHLSGRRATFHDHGGIRGDVPRPVCGAERCILQHREHDRCRHLVDWPRVEARGAVVIGLIGLSCSLGYQVKRSRCVHGCGPSCHRCSAGPHSARRYILIGDCQGLASISTHVTHYATPSVRILCTSSLEDDYVLPRNVLSASSARRSAVIESNVTSSRRNAGLAPTQACPFASPTHSLHHTVFDS